MHRGDRSLFMCRGAGDVLNLPIQNYMCKYLNDGTRGYLAVVQLCGIIRRETAMPTREASWREHSTSTKEETVWNGTYIKINKDATQHEHTRSRIQLASTKILWYEAVNMYERPVSTQTTRQ